MSNFDILEEKCRNMTNMIKMIEKFEVPEMK